jgi:hypothetical protein
MSAVTVFFLRGTVELVVDVVSVLLVVLVVVMVMLLVVLGLMRWLLAVGVRGVAAWWWLMLLLLLRRLSGLEVVGVLGLEVGNGLVG